MAADPKFHVQAMRKICQEIQNLGLLTVGGKPLSMAEIKVRRQPWRKQGDGTWLVHRGITIHPEMEQQNPGTNRSEDIGYGIGVTMIISADHSPEELGPVTDWREIIRRKFINQRLVGVTVERGHICPCTVEHADFAKDFKDHEYEISSLLIRPWAHEARR